MDYPVLVTVYTQGSVSHFCFLSLASRAGFYKATEDQFIT
jgi:hypothetical protein